MYDKSFRNLFCALSLFLVLLRQTSEVHCAIKDPLEVKFCKTQTLNVIAGHFYCIFKSLKTNFCLAIFLMVKKDPITFYLNPILFGPTFWGEAKIPQYIKAIQFLLMVPLVTFSKMKTKQQQQRGGGGGGGGGRKKKKARVKERVKY